MDTYIQTSLGILVSIFLFIVGYRQTIGAKKERTKNANHAVHRAILKRMVTEDYAPKYKDITRVLEGKAREFQVSANDLYSEEQIFNNLYTEIFDSDLISPSQRIDFEEKLNLVFLEIEKEPPKTSYEEYQQLTIEKRKRFDTVTLMVMSVSMIGAMASLLYKFMESNSFQLEWLLSGFGVFIGSVAVLTAFSVFKKSKESNEMPSRRTVQIASSEFEADVLETLDKLKLKYTVEPDFDNFRPDFLVETDNSKIIIEAKAWDDLIPLAQIRRTADQLKTMSNIDGISRVILVTKKKPPVSLIKQISSEKISVVSISELSAALNLK